MFTSYGELHGDDVKFAPYAIKKMFGQYIIKTMTSPKIQTVEDLQELVSSIKINPCECKFPRQFEKWLMQQRWENDSFPLEAVCLNKSEIQHKDEFGFITIDGFPEYEHDKDGFITFQIKPDLVKKMESLRDVRDCFTAGKNYHAIDPGGVFHDHWGKVVEEVAPSQCGIEVNERWLMEAYPLEQYPDTPLKHRNEISKNK